MACGNAAPDLVRERAIFLRERYAGLKGISYLGAKFLWLWFAALMQTSISVQGLTVEAALTGRRDAIKQAAMLDPHTAAELSLDEIAALVDDLLVAHGEMVAA